MDIRNMYREFRSGSAASVTDPDIWPARAPLDHDAAAAHCRRHYSGGADAFDRLMMDCRHEFHRPTMDASGRQIVMPDYPSHATVDERIAYTFRFQRGHHAVAKQSMTGDHHARIANALSAHLGVLFRELADAMGASSPNAPAVRRAIMRMVDADDRAAGPLQR